MRPVNEMIDEMVMAIRRICKQKGMSISQMEADLGFSPGLISRWNKTKTSPSFDKIVAIIEYLGITYDELMTYGEKALSLHTAFIDPRDKEVCEKLLNESESGQRKWHELRDDAPFPVSFDDIFTKNRDYHFHIAYYTSFEKGFFILAAQYHEMTLDYKVELFKLAGAGFQPKQMEDSKKDAYAIRILKYVSKELYLKLEDCETENMVDNYLVS